MSLHINLKSLSLKSLPFLIIVFIILIVGASLSRVARWDLLEQIAMADNYLANGILYADAESDQVHGHSVYFPGVSYIAIALKNFGIDYYLVETMLLMAVVILLLFFYVLIKYAYFFSNKKSTPVHFFPLLIAYLSISLSHYVKYACEFKPDTIALLMGYFGLYLISINKRDIYQLILGALLVSLGLLFKQQYLAFIVGLFVAAFFEKKIEFRVAVGLIIVLSSFILLAFIGNERIRFWTVEVLSDDGMLPFRQILVDLFIVFIGVTLFLILLILGSKDVDSLRVLKSHRSFKLLELFKRNPWFIVTFFVMGAALLSSLKVGGNSGNTELALVVIFPLFGLIAQHIENWKMILIGWFGVVYFGSQEIVNFSNYGLARELKNQVEVIQLGENANILTGSDVYYASRFLARENIVLENYWGISLKENSDPYPSLSLALERNRYDYMVVENFQDNIDVIKGLEDYEIVFENSLGIIAKSTN